MKKPNVLILKTDGTNCDEELFYVFKIAGGNPEYVHINQLRSKKKSFKQYHILALPGGFSYGDDIASGKILAAELTSFFKEELEKFAKRKDTIIVGICNGFQSLIRTGLLPFNTIGTMHATLTNNDSGHFECRFVKIKPEKNRSKVFRTLLPIMDIAVNHGEGKIYADLNIIKKIEDENLVLFRYVDNTNNPTQSYPDNPNGSLNAIAGIIDVTGRIIGLMPHPEKFVVKTQHPNWRRENFTKPHGLPFFEDIISFIKQA
jgi:phosphoribosylformylglycinamidine synthase I